jgi:hypothetical protein
MMLLTIQYQGLYSGDMMMLLTIHYQGLYSGDMMIDASLLFDK